MIPRPKYADTLFTVCTDDERWLHYPDHRERMILAAKGIDLSRTCLASCGATGEASIYAGDEYVLDEDWCLECVKAVEKDREFLAILKDLQTLQDALSGFLVNVPTYIIPSLRSTSRDKI